MKNNEAYLKEFDNLATKNDFRLEFFRLREEIKNINQKLDIILQKLKRVKRLTVKE